MDQIKAQSPSQHNCGVVKNSPQESGRIKDSAVSKINPLIEANKVSTPSRFKRFWQWLCNFFTTTNKNSAPLNKWRVENQAPYSFEANEKLAVNKKDPPPSGAGTCVNGNPLKAGPAPSPEDLVTHPSGQLAYSLELSESVQTSHTPSKTNIAGASGHTEQGNSLKNNSSSINTRNIQNNTDSEAAIHAESPASHTQVVPKEIVNAAPAPSTTVTNEVTPKTLTSVSTAPTPASVGQQKESLEKIDALLDKYKELKFAYFQLNTSLLPYYTKHQEADEKQSSLEAKKDYLLGELDIIYENLKNEATRYYFQRWDDSKLDTLFDKYKNSVATERNRQKSSLMASKLAAQAEHPEIEGDKAFAAAKKKKIAIFDEQIASFENNDTTFSNWKISLAPKLRPSVVPAEVAPSPDKQFQKDDPAPSLVASVLLPASLSPDSVKPTLAPSAPVTNGVTPETLTSVSTAPTPTLADQQKKILEKIDTLLNQYKENKCEYFHLTALLRPYYIKYKKADENK
ncbi:hypothetical protein FNU76_19805 [Chitinimonas arctica]|uniref:Uncharacterized protein n=1 Tax=Chitinimonas arctica TaxID=2594795 RepID=A0A516SJU7_9NEIS|nr:hypothetical protein [Chitinimonas arctica]QDQ28420.1 hypothetical protein FNU76_19805 [Chitinimonas arctica]